MLQSILYQFIFLLPAFLFVSQIVLLYPGPGIYHPAATDSLDIFKRTFLFCHSHHSPYLNLYILQPKKAYKNPADIDHLRVCKKAFIYYKQLNSGSFFEYLCFPMHYKRRKSNKKHATIACCSCLIYTIQVARKEVA